MPCPSSSIWKMRVLAVTLIREGEEERASERNSRAYSALSLNMYLAVFWSIFSVDTVKAHSFVPRNWRSVSPVLSLMRSSRSILSVLLDEGRDDVPEQAWVLGLFLFRGP